MLGPLIEMWTLCTQVRLASTTDELAEALEALRVAAAKTDAHRDACATAEYFDMICARLREHAGRAWVQYHGLWALSHVAWGNEKRAATLRAAGGIETAIEAIKGHAGNGGVQQNALWMLANVSNSDQGCIQVLDTGILPTMIASVQSHLENPRVQEQGMLALSNLACTGVEGRLNGANGPNGTSGSGSGSGSGSLDDIASTASTASTGTESNNKAQAASYAAAGASTRDALMMSDLPQIMMQVCTIR